jgi:hypothetical protein
MSTVTSAVGRHDVGYGRRPPYAPANPGYLSADKRLRQFLQLSVVDSSSTPERNACLLTSFDAGGVDFD